jgi:2,5-diketo-D-gluconate reductase A
LANQPSIPFHDGRSIPQIGLGVWRTPEESAAQVVAAAIRAGYRHVDTAKVYGNEAGVGAGIRDGGVPRSEVFLTTKVWNDDQGYDATLRAFEASLSRLGTDYADLYLIHWPAPRQDRYVETWKALVRLKQEGRARSIGVSNFTAEHLERIIGETGEKPVLNQVEIHPDFPQRDLRAAHARLGIVTESWSPLGRGELLGNPVLAEVARKHGRTPAQVVIRWHLDEGLVVIPKTVNPARLTENLAVFDFTLDADDKTRIATLERADARLGPDPMKADF